MSDYIAPKFVGRLFEKKILAEAFSGLGQNQGRLVLISGESGSGKTALVEQVQAEYQRSDSELVVAQTNCTNFSNSDDYYLPLRRIFSTLVRIETEQKSLADHALDTFKLSLLKVAPDLISHFIPASDLVKKIGSTVLEGSGLMDKLRVVQSEEVKSLENINTEKIISQYVAFVINYVVNKRLFIFIDDVQWADNGSLEIILALSQAIAKMPVLIVLCCQSEALNKQPQHNKSALLSAINQLHSQAATLQIGLDYNDKAAKQDFVDLIVNTNPNQLSREFRQQVQQHTNGNALFVKELLQHLLQKKDIQLIQGVIQLTSTLNWEQVPNKISAVISERLSQLQDEELEILHIASVQGRSFYAHILASILATSERKLIRILARRLGKGLSLIEEVEIERQTQGCLYRFQFCHGVVHRFLYDDIGMCEKAYLHQQIAVELENQYLDQCSEYAAQLAYHFTHGHNPTKALEYLLIAGKKNLALGAYKEAISYLQQSLIQLAKLDESESRDGLELTAQAALGMAIRAIEGWTSEAARRAYERAVYLGKKSGSEAPLLAVYFGLWTYHLVCLDLYKAQEYAQAMQQRAQTLGEIDALVQSSIAMGNTLFWQGHLDEAKPILQKILDKTDDTIAQLHIDRFGQDSRVFGLMFLCLISGLENKSEKAREQCLHMLEVAKIFKHDFTYAIALQGAAWCMFNLKDVARTKDYAEQLIKHCEEHNYPFYQGVGLLFRAWAQVQLGRVEPAVKDMAIAASDTCLYLGGGRVFHSIINITHAEILFVEKRYEEGRSLLKTAIDFATQQGELVYLSELNKLQHRFEGVISDVSL
jgi:predicted ATPase